MKKYDVVIEMKNIQAENEREAYKRKRRHDGRG